MQPKVKQLIEDRAGKLSSDLRSVFQQQFTEFCHDVLGIVTSEFGDALNVAQAALPGVFPGDVPGEGIPGEIHDGPQGPERREDGTLIDPPRPICPVKPVSDLSSYPSAPLATPPTATPSPSPTAAVALPPGKYRSGVVGTKVKNGVITVELATKASNPSAMAVFEGIERLHNGKWRCITCNKKFPSRRGATTHSRKCLKPVVIDGHVVGTAVKTAAPSTEGQGDVVEKKRECIAPNCKNPSKGPRFHHLCEAHKQTPIKQVHLWQRANRGE